MADMHPPRNKPTSPGEAEVESRGPDSPTVVDVNLQDLMRAHEAMQGRKTIPAGEAEGRLSISDVEGMVGVEMPERLRQFLSSGEAERYEGSFSPDLGIASSLPLRFLARALAGVWIGAMEQVAELPSPGLIPVAVCPGTPGGFLVAVDAADPNLPVFFFEEDRGFIECAPAFDDFLKGCSDTADDDSDALTPRPDGSRS